MRNIEKSMAITKTRQFGHASKLVCRECDGTGEDPASETTIKQCSMCEGTGEIIRVVKGTVEIMTTGNWKHNQE
jgi:DnaJ-class molecular chaperone